MPEDLIGLALQGVFSKQHKQQDNTRAYLGPYQASTIELIFFMKTFDSV